MRNHRITTFTTLAALMLAVLAGAACDPTKAIPAAPDESDGANYPERDHPGADHAFGAAGPRGHRVDGRG